MSAPSSVVDPLDRLRAELGAIPGPDHVAHLRAATAAKTELLEQARLAVGGGGWKHPLAESYADTVRGVERGELPRKSLDAAEDRLVQELLDHPPQPIDRWFVSVPGSPTLRWFESEIEASAFAQGVNHGKSGPELAEWFPSECVDIEPDDREIFVVDGDRIIFRTGNIPEAVAFAKGKGLSIEASVLIAFSGRIAGAQG